MNPDDRVLSFVLLATSFIMLMTSLFVWSSGQAVYVDNKTVVLNNTVFLNNTYVYTNVSLSREWFGFEKSQQCIGFDISKAWIYNIQGNSMQPTLNHGNRLLMKDYNPRVKLVAGDIVIAQTGGARTIHRIDSVYDDGFTMKGDNNPERDDYFYRTSDIVGVVCGVLY